jgi:hypothetical protein
MMQYITWIIVSFLGATAFSLLLYFAVRNTWPTWPRLVQILWFGIALLGIGGFPVTAYLSTPLVDPQFQWGGGYTAVALFGLIWMALVCISAIVTFILKVSLNREAPNPIQTPHQVDGGKYTKLA